VSIYDESDNWILLKRRTEITYAPYSWESKDELSHRVSIIGSSDIKGSYLTFTKPKPKLANRH
jgi:hypothetical protein